MMSITGRRTSTIVREKEAKTHTKRKTRTLAEREVRERVCVIGCHRICTDCGRAMFSFLLLLCTIFFCITISFFVRRSHALSRNTLRAAFVFSLPLLLFSDFRHHRCCCLIYSCFSCLQCEFIKRFTSMYLKVCLRVFLFPSQSKHHVSSTSTSASPSVYLIVSGVLSAEVKRQ